jgi:hypothetical protein
MQSKEIQASGYRRQGTVTEIRKQERREEKNSNQGDLGMSKHHIEECSTRNKNRDSKKKRHTFEITEQQLTHRHIQSFSGAQKQSELTIWRGIGWKG